MYKNEDLAECSIWARYIWPGLWMMADREGRLEDRPKRIKGELLPYDSQEVEPLLNELENKKFIVRYEADDQRYIQILKFHKHQNPHHREPESTIPPPQNPGLSRDETKESPRLDGDGIDSKPRVQGVLNEHKAQVEPRNFDDKADLVRGSSRADSLIPDSLIPESGFPDSLIPDSPIPSNLPSVGLSSAGQEKPPGPAKPKARESRTHAVWDAYSTAYRNRYEIDPIRNAKVNGQLAQLVSRVGEEQAPRVAAYYVGHQRADYVRSRHCIDLLLRDCEGIHTDMQRGTQTTATQAAQADRTQTNFNAFAPLIEEARARERKEAENA